jgi:hypothetical protein
LTERRLDVRHEWLCGAGDEVPPSALRRGLSAYVGGDSTATAGDASIECAAGVARPVMISSLSGRIHRRSERGCQVPSLSSTSDRNLSKTIL